MKKLLLIVIAVFMISCIKTPQDKIVVGMMNYNFDMVPGEISLFKEQVRNDTIIVQYYKNPNKLAKDLANNKIDGAIGDFTNFVQNEKLQQNISPLFPVSRASYGILAKTDFNSVMDLKGKTIGVVKNSVGEYISQLKSDKENLNFQLKEFSSNNSLRRALNNDKVAAIVLNSPEIQKVGFYQHIIYFFDEDYNYFPTTIFAVNTKAFKSKNSLLRSYTSDLWRITNALYGNPRFAQIAIFDIFKIREDWVLAATEHLTFLPKVLTSDFNFIDEIFSVMEKRESKFQKIDSRKFFVKE